MDGWIRMRISIQSCREDGNGVNEWRKRKDLICSPIHPFPILFWLMAAKIVRRSGFLASAFKGCKDGGKAISRLFSVGRQPFAQKGLFPKMSIPKFSPNFAVRWPNRPKSAPQSLSQFVLSVSPANGLSEAADHCGRQWREWGASSIATCCLLLHCHFHRSRHCLNRHFTHALQLCSFQFWRIIVHIYSFRSPPSKAIWSRRPISAKCAPGTCGRKCPS